MEQFFIGIDNYFLHAYSLLLMAGILVFKRINSYIVSATVMLVFEAFFGFIEDPLFNFILTLGTHSGRITWYLSWILFNLISIRLLDYYHEKLSLSRSSTSKLIRLSFCTFVFIYIVDCFDRYITNYEFMYTALNLLKVSIQLGIITLLFAGLFIAKRKVNLIPDAAHNRSVNWFQSLQHLPPLQRARELEKWEEFTNELPSDENLNIRIKSQRDT